MLLGMITRGRIATSYLFSGEQGIGKKTTALNFAKALNCQRSGVGGFPAGAGQGSEEQNTLGLDISEALQDTGGDACDACDACLKIDAGTHPDVLLISPEERQIRIEEIRTIENALAFRPYEGRYKVVIVDDADAMNIAAANAFLKTLEEPPEESIIILVTSRPDRLPDTIRSRCSRISFGPLSLEATKQVLRGRVPDAALDLAARNSMGRPGFALNTDMMEERAWFLGLLEGMLRSEKDSWSSREEMDRWFELCLAFLRDLAVYKVTGGDRLLIQSDLGQYLAGMSKSLDITVIIKIYQEISLLRGRLVFNLNKGVTWNYTAALLGKELSAYHV